MCARSAAEKLVPEGCPDECEYCPLVSLSEKFVFFLALVVKDCLLALCKTHWPAEFSKVRTAWVHLGLIWRVASGLFSVSPDCD